MTTTKTLINNFKIEKRPRYKGEYENTCRDCQCIDEQIKHYLNHVAYTAKIVFFIQCIHTHTFLLSAILFSDRVCLMWKQLCGLPNKLSLI